jgi:hypothetical protein
MYDVHFLNMKTLESKMLKCKLKQEGKKATTTLIHHFGIIFKVTFLKCLNVS